jgi:hypothetical protein
MIHNLIRQALFLLEKKPDAEKMNNLRLAKNTKTGKNALILGNGPSLDKLLPERVRDYVDDIFVVNEFCLTKLSNNLVPSFYVLSDGNSFKESETGSLYSLSLLNKFVEQNNMTLVLPHTVDTKLFDSTNILFFDDREIGIGSRIDPTKPRNYISVTLYKAFAVAQHMGYEKIFVLGLDNTEFSAYRGTTDNKIFHTRNNYASEKAGSLVGEEGRTMDEFKYGMAGRMESYALLFGDLFKFDRTKFIMLDKNSLIDAFEKLETHPMIRN